jgi:uncharacterized delta-60 repeat protein
MKSTRLFLGPPDFSKPPGYSNFRYHQRNCSDVAALAERPAIFKFKPTLLLISVVAQLAAVVPEMRGQSALDGFDPNANGTIRVVVVQPDGKILIGGDFTTLQPYGAASATTRNRIARLNPDGTLDLAFNPNANGRVDTIAVQADGKILVGGVFSQANGTPTIGGQTRNFIARLDPTTGAADSWNPNANLEVFTIAVQADGKILAGGDFVDFGNGTPSIGGQIRNSIGRLDPTTGAADSWNPNANNRVRIIVVQTDGKILAGGDFSGGNSIGGQTRNRIARLDGATGLADSFNPSANSSVRTIAVQADGKVLAGGVFTNIGGQSRNFIARLDAPTGLATDSFNPNSNNIVESIAVQTDGKILAGGDFSGANSIGGQTRNRIARLEATNGQADSFDPNADNIVNAVVVQADGKVLAGGQFTTIVPNGGAGWPRNRMARLEIDGTLDRTFIVDVSGGNGSVFTTAAQPDGKILIGGSFSDVSNVPRNNIARLSRDGTVDTTFDPNSDNDVRSITVQADGRILVGGRFTSIGGALLNRIARLDATGGADTSFNPNANDAVGTIVVQADGKILVGGDFFGANSIGGQTRNRIARLDATGAADPSFDPNANNRVDTIAVQADGKILIGGDFTSLTPNGGAAVTRNHIARLNPDGTLDPAFNPNANGSVDAIAVQGDGKILVGGDFYDHGNGSISIGGQSRNRIARLDATGAADSFDPNASIAGQASAVVCIAVQADGKILVAGPFDHIGGQPRNRVARLDSTGAADSFDPNANRNGVVYTVYTVAVQADGKILVGGDFTSIGGQTRIFFARLSNNTAALQNLAVTQSTVTWTLAGSSALFAHVTFEYSTNNVSYTPLGNGIPLSGSSNWSLTGLNLPTGQNIYIRARGYYPSGAANGSQSITESVRNAFIAPPTPTSVVSLKTHGSSSPFPINLPLTGSPGIECRKGQGVNADQHQVVFTFNVPITLSGSPAVSVSAPAGGTPGATASVSGSVVTVNLTGILNAQTLTITLTDVNDSGPISVSMGVLLGDVNGDSFVLSGDYTAVRQKSGATVDGTNFQYDINADGFILSGDYTAVRQQSGAHLSAEPGPMTNSRLRSRIP